MDGIRNERRLWIDFKGLLFFWLEGDNIINVGFVVVGVNVKLIVFFKCYLLYCGFWVFDM